jgi:hypothetical protein
VPVDLDPQTAEAAEVDADAAVDAPETPDKTPV